MRGFLTAVLVLVIPICVSTKLYGSEQTDKEAKAALEKAMTKHCACDPCLCDNCNCYQLNHGNAQAAMALALAINQTPKSPVYTALVEQPKADVPIFAYTSVYPSAVKSDLPLVIGIGQLPPGSANWNRAFAAKDELPNYSGIVVTQPSGGSLYRVVTLSSDATAADIQFAIARQTAMQFAQSQPSYYNFGAGGSCANGACSAGMMMGGSCANGRCR